MKAVLFDLDETLLDRSASMLKFLRWQAHEQLGSGLVDKEQYITRFIQLDNNGALWKDKVYAALLQEFSIETHTTAELLATYEEKFCDFCMAKPGAAEALTELESMGLKMALVSNGPTPFQERNFSALEFNEKFEQVVVSAAVGLRKPESAIFQLACERLSVEPRECAFVGDNPIADIEGANAAGIFSVFVPSKRYPACEFADAVCTDFRDLPSIVSAAY